MPFSRVTAMFIFVWKRWVGLWCLLGGMKHCIVGIANISIDCIDNIVSQIVGKKVGVFCKLKLGCISECARMSRMIFEGL